jgi:predicted ATPase/transcriptional regulator with XRE-family HTH domain
LRARLTQEVLAERAGVGVATIAALEEDRRRRPYPNTMAALAEALELEPDERAALQAAVPLRGQALAPSTSAETTRPVALDQARAVARVRLPAPPTPLIGRETEVAAATALLDPARSAVRLLTLVGPGGVGKTRLALAVAACLGDAYPDGVVFVDLAPVRDPRLVPATIAHALEVREAGGRSARELLLDYLQPRQVLLVLDNFEHLLGAAPLLAELLAGCPHLALLVTSRAALRLRSEQRFPVPPLASPADELLSMETLVATPAVRLFVERAQAVASDFILDAGSAQAVAAICRRLDGMPLAIELAAARVGLLRPEALRRRLEHRLPLLTGGAVDLPERQQTLRQTLAWSYDLLSRAQQTLFRRLGVFAGGCVVETANIVCNPSIELGINVLDGLTALVDQSLLYVEAESDGEPRFRMLESIREYAWEQLVGSPELRLIQQRHAQVFLGLAEAAEEHLRGPDQAAWQTRVEEELANLRAAVEWSLATGELEPALRAAGALWMFWFVRGYATEGRQWLEALLAQPTAATAAAARAKALFTAGMLAVYQGDHAAGRALHEEGLALQRQLGDRAGIAAALYGLAWDAFDAGDLPRARGLHEEALAIRRELGDPLDVAISTVSLGTVMGEQDDTVLGRQLLEEGLAMRRKLGDRRGIATALCVLAHLAGRHGDHAGARSLYGEGLAIARELDDRWILGHVLAGLAALAAAEGRWTLALRLHGAAAATCEAGGVALYWGWRNDAGRYLAEARQALGAAAFDAACAQGREMTRQQAITYALELDIGSV